jgi:hypothetical protein
MFGPLSSLNVTDEVSHPYKKPGNIIEKAIPVIGREGI